MARFLRKNEDVAEELKLLICVFLLAALLGYLVFAVLDFMFVAH